MGGEPSMEEWEQTLGADLRPHLVPAGQLSTPWPPSNVNHLPPGAHADLSAGIGRYGLEDLLIMPSAARSYRWLRRRFIYTPLCVLGVGERAVALWVQAPPEPGIRAMVPLGEIAAISRQTRGTLRQLLVTGPAGRLPVRYDMAGDAVMDALIRRLRRRAVGHPAPVPADDLRTRFASRGRPGWDLTVLRLDPADEVATAGSAAGRGACLVAVTPYELLILRSRRSGRVTDWLLVPRRAIQEASIRSGSLLLRSAGVDFRVRLRSRKTAATAAAWLEQVLGNHDHSGTSS
jgi:hypothetical protein